MKVEQKSMLEDLCHALKILLLEEKYKSLALLRSIIMMKWNMKVIKVTLLKMKVGFFTL